MTPRPDEKEAILEEFDELHKEGFDYKDVERLWFSKALSRLESSVAERVRGETVKVVERHLECKDQPCDSFATDDDRELDFPHQCPECLGYRGFCQNCYKDHHMKGWKSCCLPSIMKEITGRSLSPDGEGEQRT